MHIKEVKVSVLIYVLNDQPHIEKCVRSVMDQSLQEIEIILIDGGSTDRTPEIIEQLRQEDERIKLIQSDSGVGCQFNTGLRLQKENISVSASPMTILRPTCICDSMRLR